MRKTVSILNIQENYPIISNQEIFLKHTYDNTYIHTLMNAETSYQFEIMNKIKKNL